MEAVWKEDGRIQPENRWLRIPEVFACTGIDPDFETVLTISGVVFLGAADARHQCRPATAEDLQREDVESPIEVPAFFKYGEQTFSDLLVGVFGA